MYGLNTSEKYINYCDLEYLEDLKDAQENNGVNNNKDINRQKFFYYYKWHKKF